MKNVLTDRSSITKMQAVAVVVIIVVAAVAGVAIYFLTLPTAKPPVTLTWAYFEWLPGRLTGKVTEGFTKYAKEKLGYEVYVKMDLPSVEMWHDRAVTVAAAKSPEIDIFTIDSQWTGEFAGAGHIIELTEWAKKEFNLADIHDNLIYYYMTYPQGSEHIYGMPHEGDTLLMVYRDDLFNHPEERAAFKAKYGYDLPSKYEDFPITLDQYLDIAKFFTRKAGEKLGGEVIDYDFYGSATHFSVSYDAIACPWNSLLWSFGGALWDEKTYEVRGYINGSAAIEAMEYYKKLFEEASPPGAAGWWFDECNSAMMMGKVAMIINWAGFIGVCWNPETSKVADKIKCVVPPKGPKAHWWNIGGQPMVISAYSQHKEEALELFKWWFMPDQQWMWSEGGGGVCLKSITRDPRFIEATPYNRAFADSLPVQRDFWNIPEYSEMLKYQQEYLTAALIGEMGVKEALDALAQKQYEILKEAGYYD